MFSSVIKLYCTAAEFIIEHMPEACNLYLFVNYESTINILHMFHIFFSIYDSNVRIVDSTAVYTGNSIVISQWFHKPKHPGFPNTQGRR